MAAPLQGLRRVARGLRSDGHPGHDPPDAPPRRSHQSKETEPSLTFQTRSQVKAGCRKSARPVVCPGKAGMFSRRQTCRGKSQSPVVWIAEVMETESLFVEV